MRFALMLANGGEGNGVRLLSRKTVELMASDHLGPALSQGPNFAPGPGYGFGLTVAVRTQPGMAGYPGSVGEYNWGGAAGTAFWVDPKERLVPIMLIQAPGQRLYYRIAFRGLVYQSIMDYAKQGTNRRRRKPTARVETRLQRARWSAICKRDGHAPDCPRDQPAARRARSQAV
jgi:CubicO group peptidase (beta-lactamase class C family)